METHYDETTPASHDTLPPGTYTARAVSWAWDTDRDSNPCIKIMFALSDGRPGWQIDGTLYLDESKADAKGRTALDRSMEALRAMGLTGDLTAELNGLDAGEVSLVTDINERGYARVKWINAPRSARELRTFAPPAAPELNGFLAKLNARSKALAARAQASGSRPATTQSAASRTAPQTQQNDRVRRRLDAHLGHRVPGAPHPLAARRLDGPEPVLASPGVDRRLGLFVARDRVQVALARREANFERVVPDGRDQVDTLSVAVPPQKRRPTKSVPHKTRKNKKARTRENLARPGLGPPVRYFFFGFLTAFLSAFLADFLPPFRSLGVSASGLTSDPSAFRGGGSKLRP
jgi:hypothetical protein